MRHFDIEDMTNFTFILLQQAQGNPMIANVILIGGILVVFYFFMIRPQQRKSKLQQQFKESIKKGNKVVTIGGLHGKIHAIEEETIIVEIDKGIKLTFDKNALSLEATKRSYPNQG